MSPHAVEILDVGKRYRLYPSDFARLVEIVTGRRRHKSVDALHGIDLRIESGEVLGIVGRNGAGKSTLLKIIAGLLTPSDGEIVVNGRVSAILELGAAFHPEMTGRDNVYLCAAIFGFDHAEIDALFPQIAAFADIGDAIEHPVKMYSTGMAARLAFAVATAVDPDILIIDEALSVGDGAFARKSFDRIMHFRDAGKTILFCSHSTYHIQSICDSVLWLDEGRVRLCGKPEPVLSAYQAELEAASKGTHSPFGSAAGEQPPVAATPGQVLSVDVAAGGTHGTPAQLRSGESTLTINVRFRVDPTLPEPSLGVAITTADNRPVFGAASLHDGVTLHRDAEGIGEARLEFPRVGLLRGLYSIHVFLSDERALHVYDQAIREGAIEVIQSDFSSGFGVVSLPRSWHTD